MFAKRIRSGPVALFSIMLFWASAACSSPDRHVERGDAFLADGKTREAIIEYLNAIQLDADHPAANVRLANVLYDSGQIGPAAGYLQRAVGFEPQNTELRTKLATVYLYSNRAEEAREEAARVLDAEPANLDALAVFANTVTTEGEIDGAIRRVENAREANEPFAKYHLILGTLSVRKGDVATAETHFQEAARREPDSPDAYIALGVLDLGAGKPADAKEKFDRAAGLAPTRSPVKIRVADFYRLMGQPDQADALLDDIVKEAPDFSPAWQRIAQFACAEQNNARCQEALGHLLEANPNEPEALRMMGESLLASGDAPGAQEHFRKAIASWQNFLKRRPDFAAGHFRLAQLHTRINEVAQAKNELKSVLELAPNSPSAILLLSELEIRTGDAPIAATRLRDLVARQPSAFGYDLLGQAYMAQKDYENAAAAFRVYVENAPEVARAHATLGGALAARGDLQSAVSRFEKALELDPTYIEPLGAIATIDVRQNRLGAALARVQLQIGQIDPSARHQFLLGQLYLASNQLDSAEDAFAKAAELDPNMTAAYAQRAAIYVRTGRTEQALEELYAGLEKTPKNVQLRMLIGMLHHQEGDTVGAEQTYEDLLGIEPRFAPAANNLAYIYLQKGELEQALKLAEIAHEEAPDNPDIADTLGWILYQRGTYERARGLLRQAADGRPDNAEVLYHLGFAHNKLGEFGETRTLLERALEQGPNSQYAVEARTVLDELR